MSPLLDRIPPSLTSSFSPPPDLANIGAFSAIVGHRVSLTEVGGFLARTESACRRSGAIELSRRPGGFATANWDLRMIAGVGCRWLLSGCPQRRHPRSGGRLCRRPRVAATRRRPRTGRRRVSSHSVTSSRSRALMRPARCDDLRAAVHAAAGLRAPAATR
ncbi:hypothetical protein AXF42_Ash000948 [Apostasia shenzhenica]|uniref:Uncharacterized protein n=1 Tax=Apostasia shenzhenica TaxID=1088818 RepID=A0A2I0ATI1_9ASPA|nr:hypothetical protein AXF42_Ash000948 [Apostasia shenzhenica]